jgi:hypothetical protein
MGSECSIGQVLPCLLHAKCKPQASKVWLISVEKVVLVLRNGVSSILPKGNVSKEGSMRRLFEPFAMSLKGRRSILLPRELLVEPEKSKLVIFELISSDFVLRNGDDTFGSTSLTVYKENPLCQSSPGCRKFNDSKGGCPMLYVTACPRSGISRFGNNFRQSLEYGTSLSQGEPLV